jgi:hypothetical protein
MSETDTSALLARVQALEAENAKLTERCAVLEPGARNYNPMRLRAEAAEAKVAELESRVRVDRG